MIVIDPDRPVRARPRIDGNIAAAEAALRRGATVEARGLLVGRRDGRALVLLGISHLRDGCTTAAIEAFGAAAEAEPLDEIAHAYCALALVISGDVERAQAELDRAIALAPTSFTVHLIAAQFSYRLGCYPEAVRRLNTALALGAPDVDAYTLATNLLRLARERARGNFERRTNFAPWERLLRWPPKLTRAMGHLGSAIRREAH
jgi:tetratricopeptide (TPR) repeat protein